MMCSKFHSDDLKTVEGFCYTFYQQTKPSDRPPADSSIPSNFWSWQYKVILDFKTRSCGGNRE